MMLSISFVVFSIGNVSVTFYFRYRVICQRRGFSLKRQVCYLLLVTISWLILFSIYICAYINRQEETQKLTESLKAYFSESDGVLIFKMVHTYLLRQ